MRRKSQPARGAVPLATPHADVGAFSGSTGGAAHELSSAAPVAGPLALAIGTAGDARATRTAPVQWITDRVGRRRRHIASAGHAGVNGPLGAAHGWSTDANNLTAPVYLLPDSTEPNAETRARRGARAVKRGIDLVVAVIALLVASPLLAMLAVLVRVSSPGSVLFTQARVGQGGRVFRCYKFRTMREDAEALLRSDPELRATYERNGFKVPCDADHRVTRAGRVLRLTSCDELPQLWNVVKGEMSLVGPRPLVVRELAHYAGDDRDVLLSVRPGLTGAWAVGGRSRVGYPRRAEMELDYVRGWSLRRDFVILFRTVGAVLARRGAA